jgi:peptidoglycan/xylan/chitin deacetylase (PgdA/CDA1 family)
VAITFDDAYRGAVTIGIGELQRRGLPATIFVAPGLLGDQSLWWDQASEASRSPEVPTALRDRALVSCQGRTDQIQADWARNGFPFDSVALPADFRSATEAELTLAASRPGVSLGAHSWSHPNLATLDDESLKEELDRPREWLARYPTAAISCLAYPYGLHDAGVRAAAGAAGYVAGFRVDGGWLKPGETPGFQAPRLNIPAGISPERFRIHLSALPWL